MIRCSHIIYQNKIYSSAGIDFNDFSRQGEKNSIFCICMKIKSNQQVTGTMPIAFLLIVE
jgi:hypothetical protein